MTAQAGNKTPIVRFKGFEVAWENLMFRDIVASLSGGASVKPEDYQAHGVRTVPKGAVNSTGIADFSGSKFVSREFFQKNTSSHASMGDLVTSLRDLVPSAPNLGRVVKIQGEHEDFLMPQGVYKIALRSDIDESFVISYSNSNEFRRIVFSEKNGSTQVHLRNGEFLGIRIFTPSHTEQTQIGTYFRELDSLINLHQRKHDKLLTLKKAMLQKMFPQAGAATPEIRFKGYEGDWESKRVDEIAPLQRGFDLPTTTVRPGLYPVVYSNGILRVHDEYKCAAPGVVTGRSGTIGKVTFVPEDYWPHNTALWVTNFYQNDPLFIYYFYVQFRLERLNAGSTIPTLNRNDVHAIKAKVPYTAEQQKIGTYFRQLDELISKHAIQLQKLKQIKSACLARMFL